MIEDFFEYNPFELSKKDKEKLLLSELKKLTSYHRDNCNEYKGFLDIVGYNEKEIRNLEDVPFFPVRLFKDFDLLSISKDEVFKVMTSSGTTGQSVSQIYVDKKTAILQQKIMLRILNSFWGNKRLPMLIIDSADVIKNRTKFSARTAAILGLQFASKEMVFALTEDMSVNVDAIKIFLEKYKGQSFVIFGFTFIVWKHLYKAVRESGIEFDFSDAWLMTGGGWKKLENDAVSHEEFKKSMNEVFGINHFLDHYGMVEQTGCIYAECECGHLHASIYSDVIIRDPIDFSVKPHGEKGIIQVVSALTHSYPGHSLITEDEGMVLGEDDCPCGRKGKYIKILGRIERAEIRGCSDTYADKFR